MSIKKLRLSKVDTLYNRFIMMMNRFLAFTAFTCLTSLQLPAQAQQHQEEIDRLTAFAKVAGAIRHFSPTDMVDSVLISPGWDALMVEGVRLSRAAQSEKALADSLIKFFLPLEPSLKVSYGKTILALPPAREIKNRVVSKQQRGMDLYSNINGAFKSIRLNRRSLLSDFWLNYFNFVNIRIPDGLQGKSFQLKFSYATDKERLIQTFQKMDLKASHHLKEKNGVFYLSDTLPQGATHLQIEMGIMDDIGTLSLSSDSISIEGRSFSIKELTDTMKMAKPQFTMRLIENDQKLFEEENQIGDSVSLQLSDRLKISFPLAVYADEKHTYPRPVSNFWNGPYVKKLPYPLFNSENQKDLNVRLANVISIWNVFQTAYVYNTLSEKEAEELLRKTLAEVLASTDLLEYDLSLRKMLHTYRDAHIFFTNLITDDLYTHTVPITIIHVDGNYYIKKIHSDNLKDKIQLGDQLLSIDGKTIPELWKTQKYFGTGSDANLIVRAGEFNLLYGPKNSKAKLVFMDPISKKKKEIESIRDYQQQDRFMYTSFLESTDNKLLNDSTYYFNFSKNPVNDTLLRYIDDPQMHIIFDLRGYSNLDVEEKNLLGRLVKDTLVSDHFLSYHILSPTNKKFVVGKDYLFPEGNHPQAKFYFLAAQATQSSPESILDWVKFGKIGPIIGKPTAGANGNINLLQLPGGIQVTFSGIKVVNSDGTKHHLLGVQPDVEVGYSWEDVKNRRDPFIEKALEMISKGK